MFLVSLIFLTEVSTHTSYIKFYHHWYQLYDEK